MGASGCSAVLVDDAAEDLAAADRGVERDEDRWVVIRWALAQALMRAVLVEVVGVFAEDLPRVPFAVEQQPVGALLSDAADEPFRVAVRPGCPWRDLDDLHRFGGEDGVEGGG